MMKVKSWAIWLTVVCILTLGAGLAGAEGMAYREYPVKVAVTVDREGKVSPDSWQDVKPGEYIRVELFYSGGTGYEWQLDKVPLEFLEKIHESMGLADENDNRPGSLMRAVYVFRVKDGAMGEEAVRFMLQRSWEENVKPAQDVQLWFVIPE